MVDERRKSNRIDAFDAGLQVSNSIDGESLGIIGNLSAGGMMLIARRQLHADGILQLSIDAPRGFAESAITVGAKVLWCAPANSPDEFWAGLEIIDIAQSDHERLCHLLDYLTDQRTFA